MKNSEYEAVRARATRVLLARCGSAQGADVDDLTQDTCLRFLEKGLDGRVDAGKGSRVSVLCGVQNNIGFEFARTHRKHAAAELDEGRPDAEFPGPVESLLQEERMGVIGRWFRELTDRQREALIRRYGPLFGCWAGGRPEPKDYVTAHRGRAVLRRRAREAGLMD